MVADRLTPDATAAGPGESPSPGRRRPLRPALMWGLVVLLVALPFLLASWTVRPGSDHEPGHRALATAGQLEDLGPRFGNRPVSEGLDLIAKDLTGIPGVEVKRQHASGTYRFHDKDVAYDVQNVMARQAGDSDDAVLVNTHVDSALEGTGAADDGVNVGAVLEAARRLAKVPHHYTIIYLFNGGEEAGAVGADAFTHDLWAKHVRWFLNLEATGSGGLPILFQAGPHDGKLVDLVGDAPRPYGTIVGQFVFQAGLINSDTDSRVWRAHGWQGLDYALFADGYSYHTPLDRTARIEPGSAQAVTDLATRLTRDFADTPELDGTKRTPYYFDVASRWWVTLDPMTVKIWTLAVALVLALLVRRACRSWGIRAGQTAVSGAAVLLGIVTALLAGVLAGVLAWAVGGSSGWYAHPWLVYLLPLPLTVLAALVPQLVLQVRRMRRDPAYRGVAAATTLLANACAVTLLSVITAWLEIGPAYILWTGSTLLTVAVGWGLLLHGTRRGIPLVLTALVQCVLVAELGHGLLTLAIPMMGRLPTAVPMDPVIGAVVALVAVLLTITLAPVMIHAGRLRWFAAATAGVTVCGLVISAVISPYGADRPKLITAIQEQSDGQGARIVLEGRDFLTPQALGVVDRVAGRTGLRVDDGALVTSDEVTVPSADVGFTAGGSARPLTVRIAPNRANLIRITVTGPVTSVNGRPFHGGEATVDLLGHTRGFTAEIARTGPVKVQVDQVFLTTGSDMKKVLAALPAWAVGHGRTVVQHTYSDRATPTATAHDDRPGPHVHR